MRRTAGSMLVALALLITTIPALANYILHVGGDCPGGGSWYQDLEYDNNDHLLGYYGRMCNGDLYRRCGTAYIHSPTNDWGMSSDYLIQHDDGTWTRYNVDPITDLITQAWGQAADGTFWMCDQWSDVDNGGGGGVN